jgi:regulator of protease activity HflC (stomatin/prohibitin superfamily)
MSNTAKFLLGIFIVSLVVGSICAAVFLRRVDPGEVGVLIDYGRGSLRNEPVVSDVPTAKYFIVNPITQRLAKYPVKQQTLALKAIIENNQVVGGDAAKCSDQGGIPLWIDTTVLWRVNPDEAAELYLIRPGYSLDIDNDEVEADDGDIEQTVVLVKTVGAISQACSEFAYTEIFGEDRDAFGERIAELLLPDLESSHIILDDFIVGEINSTIEIENSLSTKSSSEQQAQAAMFTAQEARNKAQGEADSAVITAQGEADAVIIAAGANAESIRIEAGAQAEAIQLIADELAKHGMTLKDWKWLEEWDGQTPETLVLSDENGSPLLTIDLVPTPSAE